MTIERPDSAASYTYRPSALGAPWTFRITLDAILWDKGRQSGSTAFRAITRVRLSYRPVTMQTQRYRAEIWSQSAAKLVLVSTSWKSMVEQERQDTLYGKFLEELHRRIASESISIQFETGVAPLIYWPGLLLFAGTVITVAVMVARAIEAGVWAGAAIIAGFFSLFLWHAGNYFRRNRPGNYDPRALPPGLLPPIEKA